MPFLVFHDLFDNGAMDVYPCSTLELAVDMASRRQQALEERGEDDGGFWAAYPSLPPNVQIYRVHRPIVINS